MEKCDFCGKTASRDTKTVYGVWAFVCDECFKKYGTAINTVLK